MWHNFVWLIVLALGGIKVAIDMKLNLMIHGRYGCQSTQIDKLNKWYDYSKALSSTIWTLEGAEFRFTLLNLKNLNSAPSSVHMVEDRALL